MSSSTRLLGQRLAMRSRVWVIQAWGSTSFILAVVMSVAMVAQVRPPPSDPANRAFLQLCKSLHKRNYVKHRIMRRYRGGSSTAAVSATMIST